MNILKTIAIAAVAVTGFAVPAAPALAQHHGWHGHGHRVCHVVGHGRWRHRVCRWQRW